MHGTTSRNVKVGVRFRPMLASELQEEPFLLAASGQSRLDVVCDLKRNVQRSYDHLFGEASSTESVFERLCRDIVLGGLQGINGTVFAYGQTSSGKTHTIMGNAEQRGIVQLAVEEIFRHMDDVMIDRSFVLSMSYIEVYNERIIDLIAQVEKLPSADIRVEETAEGLHLRNVETRLIAEPEEVYSMLLRCQAVRHMSSTKMNECSSRSHTILRLRIESGLGQKTAHFNTVVGMLNLVDLAGSENAARAGVREREQKIEGSNINRSLFQLSQVIHQISLDKKATDGFPRFVNYRNSLLTRLLKDSLGGNSLTAIICCCSPSEENYSETVSTLDFATKSRAIKNEVKVNIIRETGEDSEIARLNTQIDSLERDISALSTTTHENERLRDANSRLEGELRLLRSQLHNDNSGGPKTPARKRHRQSSLWPATVHAEVQTVLCLDGMNDMEDLALQGARSLDDQEDIAYLEAELSKAKEQVSASAAEFGRKREALVEEVDARETRIRHLQDEAIDLKRQLTQAADDKKKSEEEVKVVSSILASVEVDQESLQLKIEQANNKAAEDARAASEEVHAAALRERALQVQMQTLRAELAEAVDRCPSPPSSPKSDPVKAQLEVDLSRLQQEIDTLMERIHLVEVTNKSLCDRLGAAEAEIEEATQTEWTLLAALGVRCQELGALCLSHQALLKSSDANDRERAALHETVHCLTESFGALQALLSLSQGTAVQTWRYISALREQRDTQSESEMEFWRALTTTIDMGEPMECFPQKPSADWAWLSLAQSATSYVYDISARLALSEQAADVLRRDHDEIRRTAADLATTCATLEERLMVAASEGACSALLEKRTRSTGTWTGALTAGREGYLKSHVIRLESDRAAVSSEKAQVESELLEMRAQYSRAQEALSGLGTQLAHATTQLNQRDRELSALRQRLDESDVGAALLRDNADSTQAKSAVLQAQLQEREKENLELQALLEERSGLLRKAACELKCGPAKKRPSVFPKRKRRLSVVDIDADDYLRRWLRQVVEASLEFVTGYGQLGRLLTGITVWDALFTPKASRYAIRSTRRHPDIHTLRRACLFFEEVDLEDQLCRSTAAVTKALRGRTGEVLPPEVLPLLEEALADIRWSREARDAVKRLLRPIPPQDRELFDRFYLALMRSEPPEFSSHALPVTAVDEEGSWSYLGFQSGDPRRDVRSLGELAMQCLVFFAEEHSARARSILKESHHPGLYYPLAATGMNVCSWLLESLDKNELDPFFFKNSLPPLETFCCVFCYCMLEFHRAWHVSRPANMMEFGLVASRFREALSDTVRSLEEAPHSSTGQELVKDLRSWVRGEYVGDRSFSLSPIKCV